MNTALLRRRMVGLQEAIRLKDWRAAEYSYDQAMRAIDELDHSDSDLTRAHARGGDPDESHAAARSVTNLNERRLHVLIAIYYAPSPIADVELVTRYNLMSGVLDQGPSGIRSRRAELVELGLVARTGSVKIGKRMHATWWPTDAGRAAAIAGVPTAA